MREDGRHSKVERCRQVTITKCNMQRERVGCGGGGVEGGGVEGGGVEGGGEGGAKERERERGGGEEGGKLPTASSEEFP